MPELETPWPHAPAHHLSQCGAYFVTAGTHLKEHHFRGRDRVPRLWDAAEALRIGAPTGHVSDPHATPDPEGVLPQSPG